MEKGELRIVNYGIMKFIAAQQFLGIADRVRIKIRNGGMSIFDPVIISSDHDKQGSFPETTDYESYCRSGQTMRVTRFPAIEMNKHELLKDKLFVELNIYHEIPIIGSKK